MIYEQVAKYLEEKGIKQSFVCKKTGIEKNALSNTLSGDRRMTAEEYVSICDALEVPYSLFASTDQSV